MIQYRLFYPTTMDILEQRYGAKLDELDPRESWELAERAFKRHPFLMQCYRRAGRGSKLLRPQLLRALEELSE